jgi:hypothetical protein
LLRSLGLDNIAAQLLLLVVGAAAALAAAFVLAALASRRKADPIELAYRQLCRRLARRGLPRLPHEGPRTYGVRVAHSSVLSAEARSAVERFLALLETARYAAPDAPSRAKLLPQLKTLLNRIR